MGKGHFRPLQRRNPLPIWIKLDMYNYTPQATHHAKFDFDPTTWVVYANSQFATVRVSFFFPSFHFFLFSSSRLQVAPADESSPFYAYWTCFAPRMCILGVRIFSFHIFAYFSPKIIKIKSEIGNFKPKC